MNIDTVIMSLKNEISSLKKKQENMEVILKRGIVNKKRIKIRILLEYKHTLIKIYSVYKALKEDDDFDCQVIVCKFRDEAVEPDSYYIELMQFLISNDIPFFKEELYDWETDCPDIMIYTNPYDSHHPKFAAEKIYAAGIKMIYLPYSVASLLIPSNEEVNTLYNLPIHNLAWKIYVRSKRDQRIYGRYCLKGNGHVVVAGTPLDDYIRLYKDETYKKTYKKIFLWTPNYYRNWSSFKEYYFVILDIFKKHKDIGLIVRPHPFFNSKILREGGVTKEEVEQFYKDVQETPNIFYDDSNDMVNSFYISDALISDVTSILVDYQPTLKPVLFLRTEKTPKVEDNFDMDIDVTNLYYSGDSEEKIRNFIDNIVNGKDDMKAVRADNLERYHCNVDKYIGEIIKEDIKNSFE